MIYHVLANNRKPSVIMVDELLSTYPHQLSFSDVGMRIMMTSHFSPRTRLTMASRMLITEVRHRPLTSCVEGANDHISHWNSSLTGKILVRNIMEKKFQTKYKSMSPHLKNNSLYKYLPVFVFTEEQQF